MAMAQCDVCGNHYDKTMEIRLRGKTGTYDCFGPPAVPGLRLVAHGAERSGGQARLHRAERGWTGAHAADQDVLLTVLRDACRSLRRVLDGLRGEVDEPRGTHYWNRARDGAAVW